MFYRAGAFDVPLGAIVLVFPFAERCMGSCRADSFAATGARREHKAGVLFVDFANEARIGIHA